MMGRVGGCPRNAGAEEGGCSRNGGMRQEDASEVMVPWLVKDAPESVLSAQCPPWSAALARLSLSPSLSAPPTMAGAHQGRP